MNVALIITSVMPTERIEEWISQLLKHTDFQLTRLLNSERRHNNIYYPSMLIDCNLFTPPNKPIPTGTLSL